MMVDEEIGSTPSCGNVFADLDLPDPELLLTKAKLCVKISRLIKERRLTRPKATRLMGLTPPEVSELLHGRLDALGQEVEIVVRPKRTAADVISSDAVPSA